METYFTRTSEEMEDDLEGRRGGAHGLVRRAGLGSRHRCTAINARGPVSLCTHGTSLELTGLLHTPPPTTVHLLQHPKILLFHSFSVLRRGGSERRS